MIRLLRTGSELSRWAGRLSIHLGEKLEVDLVGGSKIVKTADLVMMATEVRDLVGSAGKKAVFYEEGHILSGDKYPPLPYFIDPWPWEVAYRNYLKVYYELKRTENEH